MLRIELDLDEKSSVPFLPKVQGQNPSGLVRCSAHFREKNL